jgi:hypothetical protein
LSMFYKPTFVCYAVVVVCSNLLHQFYNYLTFTIFDVSEIISS